ncbi:NAD(P)-binding protein [Trichodelitschia bisporula]|uniref:NAD(P)-binding protein n=1 Tax=Trichodelitschia bisporula TaxID=703511 RepID=A0A6G1HTA4_9PEZI|nr:NAD(P)-binding protein [Trichodelitschia bisporula]
MTDKEVVLPEVPLTIHNDTYAAIDPRRPELSAADKTVVITGAGTGIGRATVQAFALAGSKDIHILGRTVATLNESKDVVEKEFPGIKVTVHRADIADEASVQEAAKKIGAWDVLVHNAAYLSQPGPVIGSGDLKDWWTGFEINVKGTFIVANAFLPSHKPNAAFVATSSGVVALPSEMAGYFSSYTASKLAAAKVVELVAAQYPDVQVLNFHPGVVKTAMNEKSAMNIPTPDTPTLPAHFAVWASSPEAAFVRGRLVYANWDVTELKKLQDKFEKDDRFLTTGLLGFPF